MTKAIRITADRVQFGGGKFDSDLRYLRETAVSPRSTLVAGATIAVQQSGNTVTWAWQCGSYKVSAPSRSRDMAAAINTAAPTITVKSTKITL